MKKLLFLFAALTISVCGVWAQPNWENQGSLITSPDMVDEEFVDGTVFYTIQCKKGSSLYIRSNSKSDDNLAFATVTNDGYSRWAILGNSTDGFQFVNKETKEAIALEKFSGPSLTTANTSNANVSYLTSDLTDANTRFAITTHIKDANYWVITAIDNNYYYWNNLNDKLGYWYSGQGFEYGWYGWGKNNNGDDGSSFRFRAVETIQTETTDYSINFVNGPHTPSSRVISTISLGNQTISINGEGYFYQNLTSGKGFTINAGETVKPAIVWNGMWMHGFVYVDTDSSDHQFTEEELVSNTALTGNPNLATDFSEFSVPSIPGDYRMRYKVDWASKDPGGASDICTNGGYIIDVMLHVVGSTSKEYTEPLVVTVNGVSNDSKEANVTLEMLDAAHITLSLKNFILIDNESSMPIGNIVIDNISAKKGNDGLIHFADNRKVTIQNGEDPNNMWMGPMLGEIPVTLAGKADDNHLYAVIDIDLSSTLGQTIKVTLGTNTSYTYTISIPNAPEGAGVIYDEVEYEDGDNITSLDLINENNIAAINVEGYKAVINIAGTTITVTYTRLPMTVTYNVYVGEELVKTEDHEETAGTPTTYSVGAPSYVVVEDLPATVGEETTVNVHTSYSSSMPFVPGADHFYTMKEKRNATGLSIYVDPADETSLKTVQGPTVNVENQNYFQWSFVGNWYTGYALLNKQTQSYVTYNSVNPTDNYHAVLTETPAEGAYFDLVQSGGENYLKIHGTTNNAYISNYGGATTTYLTNWNSPNNIGDAGAKIAIEEAEQISSDQAYIDALADAQFELTSAANIPALYSAQAIADAQTAIAGITYSESQASIEQAVSDLEGVMDTFRATAEGKYYAFLSKSSFSTRDRDYYLTAGETNADRMTATASMQANSVFRLNYDSELNAYSIQTVMTEQYLPTLGNSSTAIYTSSEAGHYKFTVQGTEDNRMSFQDISSPISDSRGGIHVNSQNQIVVWGYNTVASHWVVIPVDEDIYTELRTYHITVHINNRLGSVEINGTTYNDGDTFTQLSPIEESDIHPNDIENHEVQVIVNQTDKNVTITCIYYPIAEISQSGNPAQVRYWFDTDGEVHTSDYEAGTISIDAAALEMGIHALYYQVVDDKGQLSPVRFANFYRLPAERAEDLGLSGTPIQVRYWFDTDGEVKTSAYTAGTIDIDAASLDMGIHALYYQVVDDKGQLSPARFANFYRLPGEAAENLGLSGNPAQVRYWFDTDGEVKTSAYTAGTINIDASALEMGIHALYYQVVDDKGQLSPARFACFYRLPGETAENLGLSGNPAQVRYWADADHEHMQQTAYVAGHTIINLSMYGEGEPGEQHTLHYQVLDDKGNISPVRSISYIYDKHQQVIVLEEWEVLKRFHDASVQQGKWTRNVWSMEDGRGETADESLERLPGVSLVDGHVRSIDLSQSGVTGDVLSLAELPELEHLNLSGNAIANVELPLIAKTATANLRNQTITDKKDIVWDAPTEQSLTENLPNIMRISADARSLAEQYTWTLWNAPTTTGWRMSLVMKDAMPELRQVSSRIYDNVNGGDATLQVAAGIAAGTTLPVQFHYLDGDANLSGAVDVLDVQTIVNESFGIGNGFLNKQAADLQADGSLNVLDLVRVVNVLLAQEMPSQSASTRHMEKVSTQHVDKVSLECIDGSLLMESTEHVSALDLWLCLPQGSTENDIQNLLTGFDMATRQSGNLCHIVLYSPMGMEMDGMGEALLSIPQGTSLLRASAANAEANSLSVSIGQTTNITEVTATQKAGSAYDLQGRISNARGLHISKQRGIYTKSLTK